MIVYFIDVPYVSSGLRRTYKKQLEIFHGDLKEITEGYRKGRKEVITKGVYKWGKKGWVNKEINSSNPSHRSITFVESSMPPLDHINNNTAFTSLELAKAAKALLIQKMGEAYNDEIKNLQKAFKKNVPDVTEVVDELKEEYPEIFI